MKFGEVHVKPNNLDNYTLLCVLVKVCEASVQIRDGYILQKERGKWNVGKNAVERSIVIQWNGF